MENDGFYTLSLEQGGCACGGTVACDKTSVCATSRSGGVGEGGYHHAGCGGGGVSPCDFSVWKRR